MNKVITICINKKRAIIYGLPVRVLPSGSKAARLVAEPYIQINDNLSTEKLIEEIQKALVVATETIQDPLNFNHYKNNFFKKLGVKSFNQLHGFPININIEQTSHSLIFTPWIKSKEHKGLVPLKLTFEADKENPSAIFEALENAIKECER